MSGTSKQYGGKEMLGGSAQSDRSELEAWLRSQTIPQALAMRARIVLGSARGESVRELAERLCVSPQSTRSTCGVSALMRELRYCWT